MQYNKKNILFISNYGLFVERLIYFVLSVFIFVLILFTFARSLSNRNTGFNEDITIIACGDSHIAAGINDSILSSSVNIALSSQPYFHSYNVLGTLLPNNPEIKTVLLGYAYHSLSPNMDSLVITKKSDLENCGDRGRYLIISPLSYTCHIVIKDGVEVLLRSIVNHIRIGISTKEILDRPYMGEYYLSNSHNMSQENTDAALQIQYYNRAGEVQNEIAIYQLYYLYRISELCNKNDVELYLLNTPISRQYFEAIPRGYIDNYRYIASTVDATLLDFHDFPLPDSCYGDADHLNYYGATEFSLFLDSLLNQ